METLHRVGEGAAVVADVGAIVVFCVGVLRATTLFVRDLWRRTDPFPPEELRLGVARSVSLGLELVLASTFLRLVAVEPTWEELGTLAALIAIKIVVNFVLTREVRDEGEVRRREEHERARAEQGVAHGPTPAAGKG